MSLYFLFYLVLDLFPSLTFFSTLKPLYGIVLWTILKVTLYFSMVVYESTYLNPLLKPACIIVTYSLC